MKSALSLFASAVALSSSLVVGNAIAQDASGEIIVYNAQHESLTNEWVKGFTKETGIKVTVRNGEDPELANQIVGETLAAERRVDDGGSGKLQLCRQFLPRFLVGHKILHHTVDDGGRSDTEMVGREPGRHTVARHGGDKRRPPSPIPYFFIIRM